jgi:propionate catabolism operon transcriptional regulator
MPHPRPQIVVLISHLQPPDFRSRLAKTVDGVMLDYAGVADIRVIDTAVDTALQVARDLELRTDVDVFVCAGATGAYLRRYLNRPVLSMRVGGSDLIRALNQARERSSDVAVVSYNRINTELEEMGALFTVQIRQAAYTTLDEARNAVELMGQLGCRAIIGSSTVLELAEQAGLYGVLSLSSDTVRKALDEALGLLNSQRGEISKRRHLNAILQHIPAGVVAVDNSGAVLSLNPDVVRLLGLPTADVLGQLLQDFCPELGLGDVLQGGEAEENKVLRFGPRSVVTNLLPVIEDGLRTGFVLVCQDASAVQRADQRIRSSRRPGAFCAKYRLDEIVGDSASNRSLLKLAERYATTDSTVLIIGESGTGKELLAQGIHNASRRSRGPFVAINCAALPESLLESELFGYEEGAFSGSRKGGKPGLLETAHRGTLFLDEIGDMPVSLQTRLLRVLQEREILRLGAIEPISIDVRVIAATHQDLRKAIERGQFRQDLFFRLNILRLQTIPLRERPEDIPQLANEISKRLCSVMPDMKSLPPALMRYLMGYQWPGNVRELENIVERAILSSKDFSLEDTIDTQQLKHLIPEIFDNGTPVNERTSVRSKANLRALGRASEADHVKDVLARHDGNKNEAAKELGVSRSTLWRRLRDE